MTVDKLKENKKELEIKIGELLDKFEKDNNIIISNIEMENKETIVTSLGTYDKVLIQTEERNKVNIEIKL